MSNGVDPHTNFGKADGVTLKNYVETQITLLTKQFGDRLDELEEKEDAKIDANKELYMQKFNDSKEAVANAFEASQAAITKSEIATEKRADSVYVSLGALQVALNEVVSRAEFNLASKNTDERYDILRKAVADIQILQTGFITESTFEIRRAEIQKQVDELKEYRSEGQGKGIGLNAMWGYVVGAIGIIIAIATLILKLSGV